MIEFYPDIRHNRQFGQGTLIGDYCDLGQFFEQSVRDQAIQLGWSNGCPIPLELTDPNNQEYGPEKMRSRYAETNFWSGVICEIAKKLNPSLYGELTTCTVRTAPPRKYEVKSVPSSHKLLISPQSSLPGYAASRILIEQIGSGEERSQERMLKALDILENAVVNSGNSLEFIARLTCEVTKENANSLKVLGHPLSQGLLEEENCGEQLAIVAKYIQKIDPNLWQAYSELTPENKQALGIATYGLLDPL